MGTKILIVDDHPAVREGLAVRIAAQPDLVVCGQAADVAEAITLIEADRPDVVVVDVQLKSGNGLDLIARIKSYDKSIGILVWSMYPDQLYAERALRAGRWAISTRNTLPAESWKRFVAFATARLTFARRPPRSC